MSTQGSHLRLTSAWINTFERAQRAPWHCLVGAIVNNNLRSSSAFSPFEMQSCPCICRKAVVSGQHVSGLLGLAFCCLCVTALVLVQSFTIEHAVAKQVMCVASYQASSQDICGMWCRLPPASAPACPQVRQLLRSKACLETRTALSLLCKWSGWAAGPALGLYASPLVSAALLMHMMHLCCQGMCCG